MSYVVQLIILWILKLSFSRFDGLQELVHIGAKVDSVDAVFVDKIYRRHITTQWPGLISIINFSSERSSELDRFTNDFFTFLKQSSFFLVRLAIKLGFWNELQMKEVDEQIRFNVDSSNFLPHKQEQQQQPMMSQTNNGRGGVGSLDRFGGVREDILQMKNELNALKKDLSSAKRGLEFDKKPLMVNTYFMYEGFSAFSFGVPAYFLFWRAT